MNRPATAASNSHCTSPTTRSTRTLLQAEWGSLPHSTRRSRAECEYGHGHYYSGWRAYTNPQRNYIENIARGEGCWGSISIQRSWPLIFVHLSKPLKTGASEIIQASIQYQKPNKSIVIIIKKKKKKTSEEEQRSGCVGVVAFCLNTSEYRTIKTQAIKLTKIHLNLFTNNLNFLPSSWGNKKFRQQSTCVTVPEKKGGKKREGKQYLKHIPMRHGQGWGMAWRV